MKDDYLSRLDDMLGEITVNGNINRNSLESEKFRTGTDSKPRIHPVWKLIDHWGGQICLKAEQLTLWEVKP